METYKSVARLLACVSVSALAACSGSGGSGASASISSPAAGSTASTSSTTTTTVPAVTIGAPDAPSFALQSQPVFNFTTSPPAIGTVMGLVGPAVKITSTSVGAAGIGSGSQAIYRGTVTSNGTTYPVFDISIPSLSLTATNVRGDGTIVTLADGSKVAATAGTLNYTLLGAWTYAPASGGISYLGIAGTGAATPAANVPTSGSATYIGGGSSKGGVVGAYFVPSGTGTIAAGSLTGSVSATANFATNAISGTMTNMTATPTSGGAATPWNDVSFSGAITRSAGATVPFNGTTSASAAPVGAGSAGFSSSATGLINGGFTGPNAQEIGATWTLTDPTAAGGGRTAIGGFAGAK